MSARTSTRGVPLLTLVLLLGGWVALRATVWESPFPQVLPLPSAPFAEEPVTPVAVMPVISPTAPEAGEPVAVEPMWIERSVPEPLERPSFEREAASQTSNRGPLNRGGMRRTDRLIAHAMLLAAGYDAGSQPSDNAPYQRGVGPIAPGVTYAPEAARDMGSAAAAQRWSMDLWALWRDDTTTALTSGRPSYGRSQIGAVLRYRLDPSSGHAPEAHLRATRALEGEQESDVAAGLSARPFPSVPVRLAAEARVTETDRGTELRGAAYAVSELPPVALPGGFTGEAYVQGGYVTGEFATPFVDGQARITRELAGTDQFRLTAGAGAWGGAQDDASRLDVGPSAGVTFDLGAARGRVSADYRFRIAGDAEPSSGPALTLTAGF
ncbi:hypothetical protein [Aurantiacibacter gilvus]|uniref:Autotransporter domain-containing protein n=1 Tax=Aurantiacibacter gilvus TaxID=3139141 RepID=A0ABU9IBW0_9SPHN